IKYEEVYLHAYESVGQARTGIGRYIEFYNTRRPHSSLQARTPDVVYFDSLPWPLVGDNLFVRRIDSVVLLPMLTCCLT
ncbi:integrase core domain-containing protein, partial [Variovorax sp. GrIS 2.14]|uniref:integrase core domain-containing protein n=1 Tax=Variovorax sp. GrIS 2.14 TaxID=3071709 RepID=UPI0038F81149